MFYGFVMLITDLYETLHSVLSDVGILLLKSLEDFLHDKVAFFLNLEVLFHVRDTVNKCLHRKFTQRRYFLIIRDITGQRQHH